MDKNKSVKAVTGFLEEFKNFAVKGNMIDLAVGIVIGTAFTAVVKSLVDNIFMPLISYVTPDQNYRSWMIGKVEIGAFISQVVNFLIVSLAVFLLAQKIIGAILRRKKAEEEKPKVVPEDILLLTEIRDLLKTRAGDPAPNPSRDVRGDTLI